MNEWENKILVAVVMEENVQGEIVKKTISVFNFA